MFGSVHMVTGGYLGQRAQMLVPKYGHYQALAIGITAGALSHFIADGIFHLDPINLRGNSPYHTYIYWSIVVVDSLLGVGYVYRRIKNRPWKYAQFVFCGAVAAYVPDIPANMPLVRDMFAQMSWFPYYKAFHAFIHGWGYWFPMPQYWVLGILSQACVLWTCWIVLHPRLQLVRRPASQAPQFVDEPPTAA